MGGLREKKKKQTRKAILKAAVTLFGDKGFEQTRIEELAQAAGIGKGTIYTYFKTKNEILYAFCEDGLEYIRQELLMKTDPQMPLMEKLMALFAAEFDYVNENREFGRLYIQEVVFPGDGSERRHRELDNQYFDLLFPILRKAQDNGELREDIDLLHLTGHFYGLYIMTVSAWYSGHFGTRDEVLDGMALLFQQALEGLAPKSYPMETKKEK